MNFDEGFGMACVQFLGSYFGDLWYSYIHLERKKLMKEQIITVEIICDFVFVGWVQKIQSLLCSKEKG